MPYNVQNKYIAREMMQARQNILRNVGVSSVTNGVGSSGVYNGATAAQQPAN
jgi:hypothetical protein